MVFLYFQPRHSATLMVVSHPQYTSISSLLLYLCLSYDVFHPSLFADKGRSSPIPSFHSSLGWPKIFFFFSRCLVRCQVSTPQVITSGTHWLYNVLFSDRGSGGTKKTDTQRHQEMRIPHMLWIRGHHLSPVVVLPVTEMRRWLLRSSVPNLLTLPLFSVNVFTCIVQGLYVSGSPAQLWHCAKKWHKRAGNQMQHSLFTKYSNVFAHLYSVMLKQPKRPALHS